MPLEARDISYVHRQNFTYVHYTCITYMYSIHDLCLLTCVFHLLTINADSCAPYRFYLLFLVGTTLFVIPTFFYFPETKGISLEEINRLFGDETADIDLSSDAKLDEKDKQIIEPEIVP